eukprot:TRINITY_DN87852_c0_g1_i1.p1 TRINITY_DN87852_c0_g1~~TRINITY_DN87852_c0_g1_i1.p1  ORF type:complete len:873 (-),score=115.58 TRINITY_DN87852_c0_g1_i1:279-2861(-)
MAGFALSIVPNSPSFSGLTPLRREAVLLHRDRWSRRSYDSRPHRGAAAALTASSLAAAAIRCRPGGQHQLRAVASSAPPVEANEASSALLSDAWEQALHGREGSVWTEPELFTEFLDSLNSTQESEGSRPVRFERVSSAHDDAQEVLLYVPGIDFAGAFAAQQFRGLASAGFELWRCYVGPEDRTPFLRMVDCLEAWVRSQVAAGRKVLLLGESFGGLLSLAVALRLGSGQLKGLVLVNPATSFGRTIWPLLGRVLAAIPVGGLPPRVPSKGMAELLQDLNERAMQSPYPYLGGMALMATVADGSQLSRIASRIATTLIDQQARGHADLDQAVDPLVESFLGYPENLAKLLPPETVRFRLRAWLRDGCESVDSELRLSRGPSLPPTLLLFSDSDRLLDSAREAERLRPLLAARCGDKLLKVTELEGSGHAPLDERVNLAKLIQESPIFAPPKQPDYVRDYEPPSLEKLEEGSANIEPIATIVSPVFCSRSSESNPRRFGLSGVPDPAEVGRPVIFVGNHQLLALDLGPLVREFLIEKGFAPRGLAHPVNFPGFAEEMLRSSEPGERSGLLDFVGGPFELRAAARASQRAVEILLGEHGKSSRRGMSRRLRRTRREAEGAERGQLGIGENFGLGDGFAKWGAVPVTPRNFFSLLKRKEAVLLFPGGAREACHGKGEKYKLFWPSKTDFVRLAARFDAIVVPFGSVGSADNVVIGERPKVEAGSQNMLAVRGGGLLPVSEALQEPPRFPSVSPRLPPATQAASGLGDRFYYSFGAPVDLHALDPRDKAGCDRTYAQLKTAVEGEIDFLLQARTRDPYRDFIQRQLLERVLALEGPEPRQIAAGPLKGGIVRSCGRRAPSFKL